MAYHSECGDHRCTRRSGDKVLKELVRLHGELTDDQRKDIIDSMEPRLTRVKTEVDEMRELMGVSEPERDSRAGALRTYLRALTQWLMPNRH